jgi:uncharacterized protein (TIGR02453 family)
MTGFRGFPRDALSFYAELRAEPTKAFWTANKQRYDESVREPMALLMDILEDEFGPAKIFRPYADVRFAKGRSPYKDHQGAYVATAGGIGWYVHLDADGLFVGGGCYSPAADQVRRFRAAVDAPTGAELEVLVERLDAAGFDIGGHQVPTRPRGVAVDHPRLELMRHEGLTAGRAHGAPAWLHTARAADRVAADWRAVNPLVTWLDANVGSSEVERPRP